MSKVAGSRCTSMSQAWCARIRPVRWLLKYMSRLGTASTNWIRSVSALFWAKAGRTTPGARTAADEAAIKAERREIFTGSLLRFGPTLGRWDQFRQASRHTGGRD